MIRTFIQQLYVREETSRCLLEQVFERHAGPNEQPSLASLEDTLASMLDQAAHTRIVIDALDESGQQKNTLEWLRRISANQDIAPHKLSVIITSREEYDIESAFNKWISEESVLPIGEDDVNKDIRDFVHSQIRLDPRLERWRDRPDVQSEIEPKLIAKACGMFRWVTCQLVTLKNCLDLADLREALDDLPDGLDETYYRILARVDARNQAKAITMLQLLVWAKRELTLNELVDALAIRQGKKGLHYDPGNKMPVPNEIVKVLPGLIVLDVVEDWSKWSEWPPRVWVRLAHLSVKEYLTSDSVHEIFKPSLERLNAHVAIVDMCITHFYRNCSELHVLSDVEAGQISDSEARDLSGFERYLHYWIAHAKIAQDDESASERIFELLTSERSHNSPFARCVRFTYSGFPANEVEQVIDMTALFYASNFGLNRVVSRLLEYDTKTIDNRSNSYGSTALQVATEMCHEETVRVLLANGATPTLNTVPEVDGFSSDGTIIALRILRTLLDHGAKPTFNALGLALQRQNIQLAQLLLENGAPVTGIYHNESLSWEFSRGTKLLHMVCAKGNIELVRLLLDYGAKIDALDGELRTALDVTSGKIKKLLLDRGADVTASRYEGCTPLHGAVRYARQEQLVSLLDNGVDIDARNAEGETALHIAAENLGYSFGQLSSWFVEKLLDCGADASIRDNFGSNALDKIGRDIWYAQSIERQKCKLRMCWMLSKAVRNQLRSAQAVSKKQRKRPRPLRYKRNLTSRKRKIYGLTFNPPDYLDDSCAWDSDDSELSRY